MNELLNVFSPNRTLSRQTTLLLISVQTAAFLLLWAFSPFVFLPSLSETLGSFSDLWFAGLGPELATSFLLNVQGILLASLIS